MLIKCVFEGETSGDYLGCFQDNLDNRLLNDNMVAFSDNNVRKCIEHCLRLGKTESSQAW